MYDRACALAGRRPQDRGRSEIIAQLVFCPLLAHFDLGAGPNRPLAHYRRLLTDLSSQTPVEEMLVYLLVFRASNADNPRIIERLSRAVACLQTVFIAPLGQAQTDRPHFSSVRFNS
jgi:hypothetical protein